MLRARNKAGTRLAGRAAAAHNVRLTVPNEFLYPGRQSAQFWGDARTKDNLTTPRRNDLPHHGIGHVFGFEELRPTPLEACLNCWMCRNRCSRPAWVDDRGLYLRAFVPMLQLLAEALVECEESGFGAAVVHRSCQRYKRSQAGNTHDVTFLVSQHIR